MITAIKINDVITPIHIINTSLIKKDIYNKRKILQGEYTSRGIIKTGSITSGTITCRLTNQTTPPLLYLITGKQTDYRHVPETRSLYQRTLEPDYENPPEFSFIEITDETSHETRALKTTRFKITQDKTGPIKLEK